MLRSEWFVGQDSSLRSFLNGNRQTHVDCGLNGSSVKTPSLRSFSSSNRQGVEDPCRLCSEWFIGQDFVS